MGMEPLFRPPAGVSAFPLHLHLGTCRGTDAVDVSWVGLVWERPLRRGNIDLFGNGMWGRRVGRDWILIIG